MSEPKKILPLLEGFLIGEPISDHDGVRCCPALEESTGKKYIVKIISVPASSDKLEALLLAGAFPDREAALVYFKSLSQDIVEEAVLLQRLARLEGFAAYERWQVVPMDNGEGYEVWMLNPYRPTLERHMSRHCMTHLGAVNLGLDLCSALAVSRRSGHVYVDLKPENILICEDGEYRIGDIGFISLSSLPYASLPDRYRSAYTPPEITDAYSALNDTMDIYAAGLILYQVYNDGVLPSAAAGDALNPPEFADPEMSAIILKACAPVVEDRWQSPAEMGQALAAYLQKNTVNDTPIVPLPEPVEEEPQPEELPSEEPSTDALLEEVDQALEAAGVDLNATADVCEIPEEPVEELPENESPEVQPEDTEPDEDADPSDLAVEEVSTEVEECDQEEACSEEEPVIDEVTQMLAQADELIAHEMPEPVVAPAPIDVPIPVIVPQLEDESEEAPDLTPVEEEASSEPEIPVDTEVGPEDTDAPEEDILDEYFYEESQNTSKRSKGLIVALFSLIAAACLILGSYAFYQFYYLQDISAIHLSGSEDRLTVALTTDIPDELLTVVCTDSYGITQRSPVVDGIAQFSGLSPKTRYKVLVEIDGFHKLTGMISGIHITQEQTAIVNFSAITGGESGSVILNFTVQGPDANEWKVTYSAEGEQEKSVTFQGRMVTISGLTIGKEYTFRLESVSDLYVVGTDTIQYKISKLIYPENLTALGFRNGALSVVWDAPEGETVESWTVRCYNGTGYDKTITVTDTTAVFEDLNTAAAYTIEVCAAGMSLGSRTYVSANSVTISKPLVDTSDPNRLTLSWDYEGTTPTGGWLVIYTLDGVSQQQVIQSDSPSVQITPMIPGCQYTISIQTAAGTTVFGGTLSCMTPEAVSFSGYDISAKFMKFAMCRTPSKKDWDKSDVKKKDYTTEFEAGESASFAVTLEHEYNTSSDKITTLFLIRDEEGNIVTTATQTRTWTSMWYKGFGKFTIPTMPSTPGNYTVEIYFNGQHVTTQAFTILL